MEKQRARVRPAFTLIELIVLIAVLVVVIGILAPVVHQEHIVRASSECAGNLSVIGAAIQDYSAADARRKLPPLLDYLQGENGSEWTSFWLLLVPYLETEPPIIGPHLGVRNPRSQLKLLLCPSDNSHQNGLCTTGAKGWVATSYAPNYFVFATENIFDPKKGVNITQGRYTLANMPDGAAQTIIVVERLASFPEHDDWSNAAFFPMSHSYWGFNKKGSVYGAWGLGTPRTNRQLTGRLAANPMSPNTSRVVLPVLLLDGSVRTISGSVNRTTWEHLCKPDDARRADVWD